MLGLWSYATSFCAAKSKSSSGLMSNVIPWASATARPSAITAHASSRVGGSATWPWVRPVSAAIDEVERLADALTRSGMPTQALADARGAQWTKAIFNASTNPVGALTGLAHGEICDFEPTRRLISGLIDECKAVAEALGVELGHDPEEMVDHAASVAHDHKASMTQDVLAHRQTEIDFLNGAIVERGEEAGIPTPLNRAIWALVKALEDSWR